MLDNVPELLSGLEADTCGNGELLRGSAAELILSLILNKDLGSFLLTDALDGEEFGAVGFLFMSAVHEADGESVYLVLNMCQHME